jgi:subfamily B ATP-binding cassette protein MsbA
MKPAPKALYIRQLSYVRPYWRAFALAVIGMVGTAATEPVFPAIMKYLLDQGFQTSDARLVWLIPAGIVLLFLVRALFSFVTSYLMLWVSTRLVTDLHREIFSKTLRLPTHVFSDESSSKFISRMLVDVSRINDAVTNVLVTVIRESLTAIALLAYLLYLDWKLTLISFLIGPAIAWIVRAFGQRMRQASRKTLEAIRQMSHVVEETVSAQKVVKIFGGERQQKERFLLESERLRRSMMREAIPASAITPITHLAASISVATIIYMALSSTTGDAGASAGGFISFITALLMMISPIKQLTAISPIVQRGRTAAESVFAFLDQDVEPDHGVVKIERALGNIEFKDISFTYPGAEHAALQNVSFQIAAGQTVALVGASGSGKSTISALLARFYVAREGQITLDGTDINAIRLDSLRHNIALVSQDVVLFNDTIFANIALGSQRDCTKEEVTAAARAANALDFILALPEGFDTSIGEDGAKLSGGQRQRIAIARAILKNAPILILDEATSALDSESEHQVQAALAELMKNRTTLVIAHRLSTIEHAHKIFVLNHGQIVEEGTHQELLTRAGYYAHLHRMTQ